MSSFDRRRLLGAGIVCLALPGCFRPMLADGTSASRLRGRIAYPPVTDRFTFHLQDSLEARLGKTEETEYRLEVTTALTESGLLVEQDNTITRIRVQAVALYALYRTGEAEPILSDRVVTESGYDSTASLFASRTTKQDIENRLARDIGERIARRLNARAGEIEAASTS